MEGYTFNIFIQEKTKYLSSTFYINIISFTSLSIGWLIFKAQKNHFNFYSKLFIIISFIVYFIIGLFLSVTRKHRSKPLLGKIDGKLTFSLNSISINDKEYNLEQINLIELQVFDFLNYTPLYQMIGDFNAGLSNGTNNTITLKLIDGNSITVKFQQKEKNEIFIVKDFLINYYRKKKMTMDDLLSIFQISGYKERQEFKNYYS